MAQPTNEAACAKAPAKRPQEPIVNRDALRRLYEIVLTCRTVAQSTPGMTGTTAHAAATIELTHEDAISSSRESMAVDLVRTASIPAAVAPANGSAPRLISRTGAGTSHLSVAAGVALSQQLEARAAVVVALTDTASMSPGAAYDALNYAAANKLPMVIVVDNMATGAQVPEFTTIAQAHGVPGFVVDGEDAVAVYRVAREAINRARTGRGPSLIECRGFESAEAPLRHLETYLEKHGLWTPEWKRELLAKMESGMKARGAA